MEECADLYFGLRPDDIKLIKGLCQGVRTILIPYKISNYLPRLCENLGVDLFGGSYTK